MLNKLHIFHTGIVCHHGHLTVLKSVDSYKRHATPSRLKKNPILHRFSVKSRIVLAMSFLMTLFVAVLSRHHFLQAKLMPINNFSHLLLRRFLSTGSFFSQTHLTRSANDPSGGRLRLSVGGSPANHGSKAFLNDIQRLSLEDHLALIPNVLRPSTGPLLADTSISFFKSFKNTKSLPRTYTTWMRRGVREVVGAMGQVKSILYLADDSQSIDHVVQILSLSQLSNVSVQMACLFSRGLSSQARNSVRNGLKLTPRSGRFSVLSHVQKFRIG
jgi:hypothetical protein